MTTGEQPGDESAGPSPAGEVRAGGGLTGTRWGVATALVLAASLAATVPTTGDIGLTWDEPAYRFSQLRSERWWGRLLHARTASEVRSLLGPDALLSYWIYGRHGINFHPPLAGQLSVLTHVVFGPWMDDVPSRRMASVLEYALAATLAFGFLSGRYGFWTGAVAAGVLICLPRVYGDGHIAGTDTPGLLLWPATAVAFWKGLHEPGARRWRVLVGLLIGLVFVQKMAGVFVLIPLLAWLVVARLPRTFGPGGRADWSDGLVTSGAMLAPLSLALAEILRLTKQLPRPNVTNLFVDRPPSPLPGWILAVPLAVWFLRRGLALARPRSPAWGVERPALEIWTSVLGFGSVVAWLGNPAWWRETLPRLAHYYLINVDRRGSLPAIQILYLGQIYEYSLPWHNTWILMAVTVPATLLAAATVGVLFALRVAGRDRLPLFFLLQFATLPIFRMFPTPAHDGVRLFLPAFWFLAALAGWGTVWLADGLDRLFRARRAWMTRVALAGLVLLPPAWQLVRIHPFELEYYNELVGGPRGAWARGFELTYWYDAFNAETLRRVNAYLPPSANVHFLNDKTKPMTFGELQSLGQLRKDVRLGWVDQSRFPYVWLLTQDSKASAFTRLLFAMRPGLAVRPRQLDGARVATVADPVAVSRAWALWLLTDAPDDRPPDVDRAPEWVHRYVPFLKRLWGEGLTKVRRLNTYAPAFAWAKDDPRGFRDAAETLARRRGDPGDAPGAQRLRAIIDRYPTNHPGAFASGLFRARPEALPEAVTILTRRPDLVRAILTRYSYTEPADLDPGGAPYLDNAP